MAVFGGIAGKTWARLLRWSGLISPDIGQQNTGPMLATSEAGETLTGERTLALSAVWACAQLITNSVTSFPLDWFRTQSGGERQPLEPDHYLSRLFYLRPNQFMKARDFRKALTLQLALWNNAYAWADWNEGRTVVRNLVPLHPSKMVPYRTAEGMQYHYQTELGVHVFAAENIVHLKGITTEGTAGLDRLDFAGQSVGLSIAADKYASKQFANGGRAAGVLTVDRVLRPDQRDQLRELYQGLAAGADNANTLWILEGGTKYSLIDNKPDELQMLQSRQHQLTEIARFWGVPGVLIDAAVQSSSSWPASFEQQVLAFLTFTLQAYIDEWEAELHDKLVLRPEKRSISCDHEVDGFVRMDSTAKKEFLSTMVQNGLLTRNEGRVDFLKRPAIDGADDLTVQVNLTPVEDLEKVTGNAQQTE